MKKLFILTVLNLQIFFAAQAQCLVANPTSDVGCDMMWPSSVYVEISSGTPPYNFTWTNSAGDTILASDQTSTYSALNSNEYASGQDYNVTISDASLCAPTNLTIYLEPTQACGGGTCISPSFNYVSEGLTVTCYATGSYVYNVAPINGTIISGDINSVDGLTISFTQSGNQLIMCDYYDDMGSPSCTEGFYVTLTEPFDCSELIFSLPAFVEHNSNDLILNGSPVGGTYSGNGVSGNSFSPSSANLGINQINYSYEGCNMLASTIIYDTTGVVCTTYDTIQVFDTTHVEVFDTTHIDIFDTTFVSISVTDTLFIDVNLAVIGTNQINTLSVYPNPANDFIIIDNGDFTLMSGYSVKIVNSIAQVVFVEEIVSQEFNINLNTWSGAGTYILYVIDSNQNVVSTKNIVLQ